MTGENLEIWALMADDGDLDVPAAHVTNAVLHGKHAWLCADIEHGLQTVRCLGDVWVLKKNQGETTLLIDDLVAVLWCAFLVAEAKPAMGWVEETSCGSGGFGALSLESGYLGSLSGDASNDRNTTIG